MKASVSELALRFARALDLDEYDVVRALLAPDCHYETRNGPIFEADVVVDSYRSASKTAHSLFDTVEYESALLSAKMDSAEISFADRLTKDGKEHVYRSRQRLYFNSGGLVRRIVHEELPGEREQLLEFCAGCGVSLNEANPGKGGSA